MNKYLNGLAALIAFRISQFIKNDEGDETELFDFLKDEKETEDNVHFCRFAGGQKLGWEDKLLVVLALAPYLRPALLDPLRVNNAVFNQRFTEVGGYVDDTANIVLPTLDTLLFLLCGSNENTRIYYLQHFSATHNIFKSAYIVPVNRSGLTPFNTAVLHASDDLVHFILTGKEYSPEFSTGFPAKKLTTLQDWDDLVLDANTLGEVEEIKTWLTYHHVLLNDWGMNKQLKPGYRSLFYGPPGTGKTFTAALLGKYTGKEIFRIDLSLIVSKFIGETEKNLSGLFDRAEKKDWILFFDEADALFGKRTSISSSHDRYANQEVSFLLQRVEDYPGVVILATNLKANIDEAFARRFQSIIHFPLPSAQQRLRLWQSSFPAACQKEAEIDFEKLASRYELSGGSIINVVRYCCLNALKNSDEKILLKDIEAGIRRELHKEGKSM